jgi:hypothetical protein
MKKFLSIKDNITKSGNLKNNQICLTGEWLKWIKNNEYYKCEIIKNEEINTIVDFINTNDCRFKINDISFLKNYVYFKITKCNTNDICAIVVLKKQNLFIKDDSDFKLYDSICIDYICKRKNTLKTNTDNDNVIYEEGCIPLKTVFSDDLETNDIINISISTFIKMFDTNYLLCFIYNLNIKRNSFNEIDEIDKNTLFSKKYFYYRPIYIDKLLKSDILNRLSDNDINIFKKIYNTFSYHISFLKNVKIEFIAGADKYDEYDLYDLAEELSDKLVEYNEKTKDVFDYIDKNEMFDILKSPLFYKFIIRNNNNEIINFVCIKWCYITNNKGKDKIYSKNGKYYCSFYSNSSSLYISYILEAISEYCYRNNILDIITLEDFFTGDETNYFKLIKKCSRYYYIKNVKTSFVINSRRNGLIGLFN